MFSLGHGDMLVMGHCFLFHVVKVNFVVSAMNNLGISRFNNKWGKEQHLFFLSGIKSLGFLLNLKHNCNRVLFWKKVLAL